MKKDSENILVRLRSETSVIHQEMEDRLPFAREDFELSEYKRLLVEFYRFYEDFEPQIKGSLTRYRINFNYSQRLKTPKLILDLQNLKSSVFSNIVSTVSKPLILDSKEKLFGALYVIEGSMLGGQIIARILKRKFNLDESNGAAFFNGYGSETGAMWNEFRTAIVEFAETSDDHDEIIAAATETFQLIGEAIGER